MDLSVKVVGADQALKALRTMEPETAKQVGKEVSSVGKRVAAAIRSAAPGGSPMTGWRETAATVGRTRGGAGWPAWTNIGATSSRRGMEARIASTGATAAIYESAGAVTGGRKMRGPGGSGDGRQFIENLERRQPIVQSGKKKGRLARKAIRDEYPQALADIRKACERAVDAVNRRMP